MNAEQFYEEFKDTLKQLGCGWGDKDSIEVLGRITLVRKKGSKRVMVKMNMEVEE